MSAHSVLSVPGCSSVSTVCYVGADYFSVETGADLEFGTGAPFDADLSCVFRLAIFSFVGAGMPLVTFC